MSLKLLRTIFQVVLSEKIEIVPTSAEQVATKHLEKRIASTSFYKAPLTRDLAKQKHIITRELTLCY